MIHLGRADEEALHLTARGPRHEEAGRQHGGVVTKEDIARLQVAGKVGERAVFDPVGGAVHDEKAGFVPSGRRSLRDEMGRQRIVEKLGGKGRHGGKPRPRGVPVWSQQSDLNR